MIVMDRHNLHARGWSHAVSTTGSVAELEAFRLRVGAPQAALQIRNVKWPHLDLKSEPRERALACADIVILERTRDLIAYVRAARSSV